MKAYLIRFEFIDSDPLIWREVWLPAGYSFVKLHDVIQYSTNFMSGYPNRGYHSFEFFFPEERLRITDASSDDFDMFNSRFTYKNASRVIYDKYLNQNNEFFYTYDFGDDWKILIRVLDVKENYNYKYVFFKDGAETAPPDDVGGMSGYYAFLEILKNKSHPEYHDLRAWASSLQYEKYSKTQIREKLQILTFHEKKSVRKPEKKAQRTVASVSKAEEASHLLLDYVFYLVEFFGLVPYKLYVDIFNAHYNQQLTESMLDTFLEKNCSYLSKLAVVVNREKKAIYAKILESDGMVDLLINNVNGIDYYFPTLIKLVGEHTGASYALTMEYDELSIFMATEFFPNQLDEARNACELIQYSLRVGIDKEDLKIILEDNDIKFRSRKQERAFWKVVEPLEKITHKWLLYGHTPKA